MPIVRVKSVKFTPGNFFYTDMSVVSVTNIRYASAYSFFWSNPWSQSLEWYLCPTWKIYSRRWDLLSPSPSSPSFLSSVSQSRRFSFHFLFCRIASVEAVSFISIISGTFLVSLPFFRAPMDRLARIAVGSNISNYIPVRRVESLFGPLGFLFSPKQDIRTVYTLVLPFQPRKVFFLILFD